MNIVDCKVYLVYFPTETEQGVLLQTHNRNKSHCGVALYMNSQASGHNFSCSCALILPERTFLSRQPNLEDIDSHM